MMLFGILWMAPFTGLPVYLVYWLTTRQTDGQTKDSSLAVLREQYARGEIDDEESERRRERLTANR